MASRSEEIVQAGQTDVEEPRSLAVARKGINTSQDFANLMSAVMSDTIQQRITPAVANAAVNAGGKLLKVFEMQMKYGKPIGDNTKSVMLSEGSGE